MPRDTKFRSGSNIGESPAEVLPDPVANDPILQVFQTPAQLQHKHWRDTAEMYYLTAKRYARIAGTRLDELKARTEHCRQDRIDQLERSTKEYSRYIEEVKRLEGEIAQLKATIHLLTDPRRN